MRHIKIINSILLIISLFLITSCSNNNAMKPEDFKEQRTKTYNRGVFNRKC
jgi:thioredoxin-related protein